ncbi:exostosin-1-like protein, partial [Leptotrombidium deliense]
TINAKLYPYEMIETDAVLNLDPESNLCAEELDFAFMVWRSFPHRIIGFNARDHYYDELQSNWFYTSKWTNQYSIILLDSAFYHRYIIFNYYYHYVNLYVQPLLMCVVVVNLQILFVVFYTSHIIIVSLQS